MWSVASKVRWLAFSDSTLQFKWYFIFRVPNYGHNAQKTPGWTHRWPKKEKCFLTLQLAQLGLKLLLFGYSNCIKKNIVSSHHRNERLSFNFQLFTRLELWQQIHFFNAARSPWERNSLSAKSWLWTSIENALFNLAMIDQSPAILCVKWWIDPVDILQIDYSVEIPCISSNSLLHSLE